jgi:hypothetical protein
MKPPRIRNPRPRGVVVSIHARNDERILADRAADNHGKSRAQVLESGGRVDKGITSEARSLDGTDDSGGENAHRARSETEAECGGLKLSSGRASNPGCRGYRPQHPRQGEISYG